MGTYQDGLSVGKYHGRASDPLTDHSEYTRAGDYANDVKDNDDNDDDAMEVISFYYDDYTSDGEEFDDNDKNWHYSHSRPIAQSSVTESRLVDARLSSDESIPFQDSLDDDGVAMLATALEEQQDNRDTGAWALEGIYYPTVLKLISGSLLRGGKYQDVYSRIVNNDDGDKDRCLCPCRGQCRGKWWSISNFHSSRERS